jgi:multidrug efflux system membrane fusion protein
MLPACNRPAPEEADIPVAIPVIVEPVRLGTIRGTVSATGVVTTLAGAMVTLSAHEPARISEISKNVGDAVKSDEVLIRFEFPSLRAQTAVNAAAVRAADLRLQQATLLQGRIRSLLSRGAASQREMDDADREVALAEGELAAAKAAMSATEALGQNTIIRAPFNGVVAERLHDAGDLVRAGESDPILRLIDPKQVQVTATVAAADITRIAIGATGRAVAEGGPLRGDAVLRGSGLAELVRVVSRPEPEKGATTAAVMLAFDSPTELAPGTQVGVEIDAEQRSNVPLVPAFAVLKEGGNPVVVVAAGSIAQRRPVIIGLTDAEHVEIRSGLKAGELIITQGHSSIRDGALISVTIP